MTQTLKEKAIQGKDRAAPQEIPSDEPPLLNRREQIAADAELCRQLQRREDQQVGALNATTSFASAAVASGANTFDVVSTASAVTSSSARAVPLNWLNPNWRVRTTGSKADKKVARRLVHNAARKIQSAASKRLASLRAEEEARFQTELHQALRESFGALPSASTSSATAKVAPLSVHPATASLTAAASAAAATPRAATLPTSTAIRAPTVAPTASSTTVARSTASTSTTAAARTITAANAPTTPALAPVTVASTTAVTPAPTTTSPALIQIASSALVFSPTQLHEMLPKGTYLPPRSMAVAMGPWGQHFWHWSMVSHQPAPHKHGGPTHFNAQNEPVNARGKPYVPPPPPGPRGCNGGSHSSLMKREKEKAKRQQKRAATEE